MGQFQINNQQNTNYTLVDNSFIDQFLAEANDAQVKVYLYLLRHMSNPQTCSISAMIHFFNYSEKDIMLALSYWERKKVIQLIYNQANELVGLTLCSLAPTKETPAVSLAKPEYTLDQLAEFTSRETTSEIMFIAESYLGRTLSAKDIRSILFISDELHFSCDLIDSLLQYCIDRGKKDFRYIEKVAISWAEANITTPEQAQAQTMKYDKDTYTVMNALGKNNPPTPTEADFIKRWYQIYGFTSDVILEACERTVLATDKHRFEYADKILSSWKDFGVRHKADISKADEAFANKKKSTRTQPSSGSGKNKFNRFPQHDYDFDALEKELLGS